MHYKIVRDENTMWFAKLKKTYRSAASSITATKVVADLARETGMDLSGGRSEGNRAEEGNGAEEDGRVLHFDGLGWKTEVLKS